MYAYMCKNIGVCVCIIDIKKVNFIYIYGIPSYTIHICVCIVVVESIYLNTYLIIIIL